MSSLLCYFLSLAATVQPRGFLDFQHIAQFFTHKFGYSANRQKS
nr:MAG TPA_asm: hypothetical protein [Caudoviricetes sp.]